MVSAAQSAFSNELVKSLLVKAPTDDPAQVVAIGATELRKFYSGAALQGVVDSYMDGIRVAFILSIALTGASVLVSFCMPWISVKGKVELGAGAA
jgi:hypothetical protein